MMYANRAAVAIKNNGKVLREFKDTVYIPFGHEYSILIKNLNSVRAVFNITIDGQDVVPGGLVLDAGQEVDLERWVKNNNLNEGNRFKFIERTSDIEDHRGVKLEDGIIRIEYQFEKVYPKYNNIAWYGSSSDAIPYNHPHLRSATVANAVATSSISGSVANASLNMSYTVDSAQLSASSYNDAGITVPGSKSEQKFRNVSNFLTETEKHVMVLKLLGETPDNKPVVKSVTVKTKPRCVTCGTQNKATAKFCSKCGTHLTIYA